MVCLQTNLTETVLTLISLNLSLAKPAGHRFPLSLAASTVGCTWWMKIEEASSDQCGCWAVVKHVPEPPSLLRQPPDQTSKTGRAPVLPCAPLGAPAEPINHCLERVLTSENTRLFLLPASPFSVPYEPSTLNNILPTIPFPEGLSHFSSCGLVVSPQPPPPLRM